MSEANVSIPTPSIIKHEGKTYTITPLGAVSDLTEHANYLRERYLERKKKDVVGLPKELALELLKDAFAYADKIKPVTEEYQNETNTVDGSAYMFWLCIRKKHDDVTLEKATEIMMASFGELQQKTLDAAFGQPSDPLAEAAAKA
jgi:hypothetical protein